MTRQIAAIRCEILTANERTVPHDLLMDSELLQTDKMRRLDILCPVKLMRIPHSKLSPATLRAIVQEFVTRDGTDYSSVERRVENVLRQFAAGQVELHFDDQTETCNIVTVDDA